MNTPQPFFQLNVPKDQRRPLLGRMALVWAMSLVIAAASHPQMPSHTTYTTALVYSFAISTSIWFLVDVSRYLFRGPLKADAPYYWPPAVQASLMLFLGISGGYVLGTWIGDQYAGHSTWDLWHLNRQRFAGFLVSSLAISMAYVGYFYQRGRAEHQERQATEAQLMLLQTQLEPHMLFNTLANLRALIAVDPARAQTMLDHLDGFLRATLSASRAGAAGHQLDHEFARLGDYLALMAVRMGPRLTYRLDLPPELRQCTVPPLLLQPLVENCIRHGLEPKVEGGEISVTARRNGDDLVLEVRDSGLGFDASSARSEGFGLSQIRQRLSVLYGGRGTLQIEGSPDSGTRATVALPVAREK